MYYIAIFAVTNVVNKRLLHNTADFRSQPWVKLPCDTSSRVSCSRRGDKIKAVTVCETLIRSRWLPCPNTLTYSR